MRVLFVAHSFPREAGDVAGAFLLRLAVALRRHGVVVDVLAPSAPGLAPVAEIEGIRVTRFRYGPATRETLAYAGTMAEQVRASWPARVALARFLLAARRAVGDAVAGGAYDVVHAHWWFPAGLAVASVPRARPLVVTLHGSDVRLAMKVPLARWPYRYVARRAAALTAVSEWLAGRARELDASSPVTVGSMPVDTDLYAAGADAGRSGVLFVGRLNAQKGVRDLLAALRDAPGVTLRVVGDGPDREALGRAAVDLGIADRVEWCGPYPQAQLAPLYRSASAVAVPSRDEGLGLVAVEALLSGTPVVAYRSGGVAELVESGVTGRLVDPGDIRGLATALVDVCADIGWVRRAREQGRPRMAERFSADAAASRYADLYAKVTA